MVDLRQSASYARYIQSLGWIVENGIFIRKLWIFGAIAKIQRTNLPKNWQSTTKKYHVWMTKLEPIFNFQIPNNFHQDNWPMLATKTLRVDITPPIKTIFSQFKKDSRYILRKLSIIKNQLSINNYDLFYDIWKKSAKRKSLWIPRRNEYQNLIKSFDKKCFCVTIGGLAGALVLIHDNVAYYYYAGATKEGTKQNLPYLVVWKAMQEAKKRKCRLWDFEGIYDERWPNKGWLGFSHFKKSFGGSEISFPGSFTKWF